MKNEVENKIEVVREALRHTEMRIANLNTLASAAETRTFHFSTLVTAIGTVLAINAKNLPGSTYALITAFLLIGLACLAVSLTLPRRFHVTGHFWKDWTGHVDDNDDIVDVLISQAEENDTRIEYNEEILERSARSFTRCFKVLILVLCFFVGSQIGALHAGWDFW